MLPQQTKPMSKSDSVKRYLYNKLINKKIKLVTKIQI